MESKEHKIALLIDGDNAQSALLSEIIEETSKYGRITIKKVYGDWSQDNMKGWKEQLKMFAVRPVQKFAYVKGKNATDIALIIDAMDILHSGKIDGFCLVSSDSDFTGLANRVREDGLFVIGIGREQTPKPFVTACDRFVFTENFGNKVKAMKKKGISKEGLSLIRKAFSGIEQDDGIILLSQLGQAVRKLDPSFDPRNYGFKNLRKLMESLENHFELILHVDNSTISIKEKD